MTLVRFQTLLKQAMGLDSESVGISAIERAVQARQRACGIASDDAYYALATASRAELQQLVEAVAVPETWFFRDRQAFAAMARFAVEQWLPAHPEGVLRLLSLPCSTGEEPYTMAMALLDAGFPAGRFRIDAFDISEKVLGQAREGVYGRNSFRGGDLAFRDRFFEPVGNAHRLSARVREGVHFAAGNLMDPMFGQGAEYDVVFCRNLLIYFDAADQARAVATLRRMLAADGMFFVGHSESGILLDKGFESTRIPLAFAFRKAGTGTARPRAPMPRPRPAPVAVRPRAAVARAAAMPRRTVAELPEIQRLADQGRLAEAASACEAYLGWHGPSADALYLLGVISDAAGQQARAADCYRKVLYLDPLHHEALDHLALLLERRGDVAGARRLNARTARLQQSEGR
ncbi:CheR family methyltransferase [Sphingomonas sp. PR090111-T3T-6A]|uniref:CheR family methyltransferase n=1 Tax=Sphingomonas sp. PR090111-T3T-6A TaxID=685778 RepID=UPI00037D16ED|nr:protein-glutamate O-methyltransferase CheR [Sphingomonas sp. PR090111-T3T-6A]